MIDPEIQVGSVDRTVIPGQRGDAETRTVTLSQRFDTTVDDLWNAVTTPDRIRRWFSPVSGDLRLGGRYQIEGNAEGTIETCEPPTRFTATWEFGGGVSWIEVDVAPDGDGARVTLAHIAEITDHWRRYGPGAVGVGWDLSLLGLRLYLESGEAVDPAEFEKWSLSAGGLAFAMAASERWLLAAVEAGDDPTWARHAAARTTAFYTAQPEPE